MFGPKKLVQPLGDITHVSLRKPDTGSLRGLKLTDILQMDVAALSKLLPRISEPAFLPDQVASLDPADLLTLGSGVIGFFVTEDQIAEAEQTLQ